MYDVREIRAAIPHRYPMLLVDRILELTPGQRVVAIKNVTANEPFFAGHFPEDPVMPGVLMLEALAQAGAFMLYNGARGKRLAMLAGIDNARFRRPVTPGDQLRLEVEVSRARGAVGKVRGVAYVDDSIAVECDIIFAMVSRADAEA